MSLTLKKIGLGLLITLIIIIIYYLIMYLFFHETPKYLKEIGKKLNIMKVLDLSFLII